MATQKRAVALRFTQGEDNAPVVVAKGKGRIAEQIMKLARDNNIPIREDKNLVQVLSLLNIDQEIPPQAYQAVAAILAFIYRLNQQKKG
ncbi:EscU/YscU/HrcU family type III secretion system export apparatus switch protein [Zavarzinella formosa]|uniref:EscU/YscU/HrcU family type III secretion system export apparatus switch protein n=1 Tax=Zavarzinella formosa TaxID=360055 RepID=UPI000379B913|nr:EscU/YscU/HrcU family type III secretion system export apparatus switch protein [Zavarzinella formosa]